MPTKRPSHPDAQYVMRPEVGSVIAKGLSVVYKEQPENPVDYFAKWLLKQSAIAKRDKQEDEMHKEVGKERAKFEWGVKKEHKEKLRQDEAFDKLNQKKLDFRKSVECAEDLNENLQGLVDHIQEFTNATGVYIGKVVDPIKRDCKDDAFDDDHLVKYAADNKATWPRIRFLKATTKEREATHEEEKKCIDPRDKAFMVDAKLMQDEGVTYSLFKDEPEEDIKKLIMPESEDGPTHIYVKEVVREPKMKFYRVPRLGSYVAIKLEYESCLNEESFDVGIADYLECQQRRREIAREKQDWIDDQADKRQQAKEDGEPYNPSPEPEWPVVEEKAFNTKKESFVVCLNTMGQDREFTKDELKFALGTVQHYKKSWEKIERDNLVSDLQWKVNANDWDKDYKEFFAEQDENELTKLTEDLVTEEANRRNGNGEDEMTENEKDTCFRQNKFALQTKNFYAPEAVLEYKAKMEAKAALSNADSQPRVASAMSGSQKENEEVKEVKSVDEGNDKGPEYTPLVPEMWNEKLRDFSKLHVVKFQRIFQTLIYLVKFSEKQTICLRDTNKLSWKQCRKFFSSDNAEDIFKILSDYKVNGPKEDDYKEYQKLAFLQDNLNAISEEVVAEYSQAQAHLLSWVKDAMSLRVNDVRNRRRQKTIEREQREEAIAQEASRVERRDAYLADKKEEFDVRMDAEAGERQRLRDEAGEEGSAPEDEDEEEFDAEQNTNDFNDENPPFDIPPEVIDDVDNDFNLEDDEEDGSAH